MVELLLGFIRAERTGDWRAHLSATAAMAPYFYSMDRTNYATWLPIYLADMKMLPSTHPHVHEQFLNGNHSVSRSDHLFNQVWTDMDLEQSINLDSKKRGGIIGITQKPGALERWLLTSHERAAITTVTKQMCGLQDIHMFGVHKEMGTNRMNRDETDVQKILTMFSSDIMTNPFNIAENDGSECLPLVNIATGVVLPSEIAKRLVSACDIGKEIMETFVQERLDTNTRSFWDTLPHLKLKTFASLAQKKELKTKDEKIHNVRSDRKLFGRLIIAARSRDVDLKEVMAYKLSAVPLSLSHTDETLRKNVKSVLLSKLEKDVNVDGRLPPVDKTGATAYVVDGMAIVQMVKTGVPLNQEDCNRVDIVFDRYDRPESLKAEERLKRGSSTALEVKIAGENTPVPKQWAKYISNPSNKSNLVAFLSKRWRGTGPNMLSADNCVILAGGFNDGMDVVVISANNSSYLEELRSDHEEADTRIMLHALHASKDRMRVVIQSPDTDVAVLSIYTYRSLNCSEIWFRTGTQYKLRYIPIHTVAQVLGPAICLALPGFHSLTGCDSTSALFGVAKRKAFNLLKLSECHQHSLAQLGEHVDLSPNTAILCEKFVCELYTTRDVGKTADETRY